MNWFECEACESDAEHQRICLVLQSEPWSKNELRFRIMKLCVQTKRKIATREAKLLKPGYRFEPTLAAMLYGTSNEQRAAYRKARRENEVA